MRGASRNRGASDVAKSSRAKDKRGTWSRTPIGPLYPAGWVLVGFFVVVVAYRILDSESESHTVTGIVVDSHPNGGHKGVSGWMCTVRTVNDVSFTASCYANTAIGSTAWACQRTRVWSGVRTYSLGRC